MEKEFRSIVSQVNVDSRKVEGYALVFDSPTTILRFQETIKKGAITDDLINNSDVFCLFNHDSNKVLARSNKGKGSLQLSIDDKGLKYSFEAPNTDLGNELLEHLKRGEIDKSSFAFSVNDNDGDCVKWYRNNDGKVCRDIYKLDGLYDVSPVFQPAYDTTSCSMRAKEMVEELDEELVEDKVNEDEEQVEETNVDEEQVKEIDETIEKPSNEDEELKDNEAIKDDDDSKRNNKLITKIKMNKEFRLLNAINSIANNKTVDEISSAVIAEGAEEMRKSGLNYQGQIQIPTSEIRSAITVASEGEDVVAEDLFDIVEPLRAKNVLVQAGAKFLTGLVGDVKVPVMAAGNVTWEGETASASDGAQTFTNVKLSPKRLTAYVDISKQFLIQDSKSAEALIRQDIINAVNSKLEETILGSASGSTTKPQGIFYLASGSLDSISGFTDICDLEASVEDANVNGDCKYIMSNKAKAALRGMVKGANGTGMVYENGAVDGTDAFNTSNVENKNIAYGDFSNLAIGQWGGIDLVVDPYTKAAEGQVRLVVNAYFDAQVLRSGAIAIATVA